MIGLAVFVGGGIGALLRWSVATTVARVAPGAFPWATLLVNVAGCFVLGFLGQYFVERVAWPMPLRVGLTTGFLGGLTTFSTFGYETVRLATSGSPAGPWLALVNAAVSVLLGLAAALVGIHLAFRAG